MIPIFRKIRKKMADDNKPVKYLRYAIGEIVLVVIGILIALQINNWNENRKLQNEELNLLFDIQSDLKVTLNNLKTDSLVSLFSIIKLNIMFIRTYHIRLN